MMQSLNARRHHLQVEVVTDLVPCSKLHEPGLVMRDCVRLVALVAQATLNLLLEEVAVSAVCCTLWRVIIIPLPVEVNAVVLLIGLRGMNR